MKATVKINEEHTVSAEYVNHNEWFGEAWLLEVGIGFSSLFFVVEGEHESGVIDEFTDSDFGWHIRISEEESLEIDKDNRSYAGNASEPVCLDSVALNRCHLVSCTLAVQ